MRRTVGFLVWNPSRRLPAVQHETFAKADTEAERLRAQHPGETFFVMAPVKGAKTATAAKAFSDGKAEGYAQARAEIMLTEGRLDRASDELRSLRSAVSALQVFADNRREFQAIVADCLLWFDGFTAAHHGDEPYSRPHVPARDKLVSLNAALQRLMLAENDLDLDDDEIPF